MANGRRRRPRTRSVLIRLCIAVALLSVAAWGISLMRPIGPIRVGTRAVCVARGYVVAWHGWTPDWWEWSRAAVGDAVAGSHGLGGVVWRDSSEVSMWTPAGADIRIAHWTALLGVPLWMPVATAIAAALALSKFRKVTPGSCPHCGYDLTGNVSGRCPECGAGIETLRE